MARRFVFAKDRSSAAALFGMTQNNIVAPQFMFNLLAIWMEGTRWDTVKIGNVMAKFHN